MRVARHAGECSEALDRRPSAAADVAGDALRLWIRDRGKWSARGDYAGVAGDALRLRIGDIGGATFALTCGGRRRYALSSEASNQRQERTDGQTVLVASDALRLRIRDNMRMSTEGWERLVTSDALRLWIGDEREERREASGSRVAGSEALDRRQSTVMMLGTTACCRSQVTL